MDRLLIAVRSHQLCEMDSLCTSFPAGPLQSGTVVHFHWLNGPLDPTCVMGFQAFRLELGMVGSRSTFVSPVTLLASLFHYILCALRNEANPCFSYI